MSNRKLIQHEPLLFRREIAKRSDKRISVMNEILNGIRVIKMYAWEGAFSQIVADLRRLSNFLSSLFASLQYYDNSVNFNQLVSILNF